MGEHIYCKVLDGDIKPLDCTKKSMILGAGNFGEKCEGCASGSRICQYCVLQGEIRKWGGPQKFHFVEIGNETCLFHKVNGVNIDRERAKKMRDRRLALQERKTSLIYPKTGRRRKSSGGDPQEEPLLQWVTLELKDGTAASIGQRIKVRPYEIYISSTLPARRNDPSVILRMKQSLEIGLQEEMVYLSQCENMDKRYRYSLIAGADTVLACKDFVRCTMNAELLEVPSRAQLFLLALQLENYTKDEMGRALKEAVDLHGHSEKFLAHILCEKTAWVKKQIALVS